MIYACAFFDLQLRFAEAVAHLAAIPLERAVLEYTNVYVRFALGRDFDPTDPVWRDYLAGLRDARDRGEWTHRFFLTRPHDVPPPGLIATFGCFGYARLPDGRLRIHFANAAGDGRSPLAAESQTERIAELATLFAHLKGHEAASARVVGASWLYNLDAYRRLFPKAYLATAQVLPRRFQHMPLWGQFVDRRGEVRTAPATEFLARVARASGVDGLDACFPLQVLRLEAPVATFHDWYGV